MPEEVFETPQTVEPTAETKPTNWPKIISAAVLGLGLLAAATYAGYWYGTQEISKLKTQNQATSTPRPTPTPAPSVTGPTAGWEIYTNTGYGFSIKYPRDWVKLEEVGNNYVRFFKGPYPEEGMPMTETYISVSLQDNPNNLSLEDWLRENPPPYEVAEDAEIDKHPAIKYVSDAPVELGKGSTFIYSEKGKNIYHISLILRGLDIEEARQVFDLMLPTFKFL